MTARASLLIDTAELAERLGEAQLRIVDIRGSIRPVTAPKPYYAAKADAYREAHVPGAVFVDWTEDIVDPAAPAHMMLAGPARLQPPMERLGIGADSLVVINPIESGGESR